MTTIDPKNPNNWLPVTKALPDTREFRQHIHRIERRMISAGAQTRITHTYSDGIILERLETTEDHAPGPVSGAAPGPVSGAAPGPVSGAAPAPDPLPAPKNGETTP